MASVRKIIHIDMDCFFAAVEVRENPELKGKPVAVGGQAGKRGVVAACNYEARAFGVHSAMPMSIAFQRCATLIRMPVRMSLYKQVSSEIRNIFLQYSDLIEPLSLDEAFIDVTDKPFCKGSASLMAKQIRYEIFEATGLTASAGIAPNKLIAKIASDWHKPNGQKVVTPKEVKDFMTPLPVSKIYGVGKVTTKKMHQNGIKTCQDLQSLTLKELQANFGRFGTRLYDQCRGIDDRPVDNNRITKSLSIEDTYSKDLLNLASCEFALEVLYKELLLRHDAAILKANSKAKSLSKEPQSLAPKTLFVKIRFHDFVTTTAQLSAKQLDINIFKKLCKRAYFRGNRPVRLLGLGIVFDYDNKQSNSSQSEDKSLFFNGLA